MTESFNVIDELDRKTLDAVAQILVDLGQGSIAQPQASYAIKVLFMATSGLAGKEAFDLVSQASAEIEAQRGIHALRRFFVQGQKVALLEYQFGESEVKVKRGLIQTSPAGIRWERASVAMFEDQPNPFESARERFDGYAASLVRAGYQEVL